MCHIHTPEHAECMINNSLMIMRCCEAFNLNTDLLLEYLSQHIVVIITNKNGIGENLFIKEDDDSWKNLDMIMNFKFTFSTKEIKDHIQSDDCFGWNVAGMGLVNFSINYNAESYDTCGDQSYIWDEEKWTSDRLISELLDTENILSETYFYSQKDFHNIIKNHHFYVYRVLYENNHLKFIRFMI